MTIATPQLISPKHSGTLQAQSKPCWAGLWGLHIFWAKTIESLIGYCRMRAGAHRTQDERAVEPASEHFSGLVFKLQARPAPRIFVLCVRGPAHGCPIKGLFFWLGPAGGCPTQGRVFLVGACCGRLHDAAMVVALLDP